MKQVLFFLILAFGLFACQSDETAGWQELDLMTYGMPLKIAAPDSVEVEKEDWGASQELWIHQGKEYDIQILSSMATGKPVSTLIEEQKQEVRDNQFFSQMILEEENGFIYENILDSTRFTYGFRYIKHKGDTEYLFRSGLRGIYTQQAVERMYESIQ